jgi:hypothetical protein
VALIGLLVAVVVAIIHCHQMVWGLVHQLVRHCLIPGAVGKLLTRADLALLYSITHQLHNWLLAELLLALDLVRVLYGITHLQLLALAPLYSKLLT